MAKQKQYRCEICKCIFDYGWTDKEAKAEADENGFDVDNCGLVCDNCYGRLHLAKFDNGYTAIVYHK